MHEEWKPIYSALVCDIMDALGHRNQAMSYDVRPSDKNSWIAGTAVTLDAYENHQHHDDPYGKIFAAYDQVKPGDVFVAATNGETKSGLWGELLSTAAKARSVEAVITDGLVRDIRQMNDMGFNCFCKGYSPLDSAGRIIVESVNESIQCGGVTVCPGDFMLADYDGVAVIPAAIKDEVFKLSMEKLEGENTVREALVAGRSPREVFDEYGIL
ncbi:MAG: 4-hydroxy-4-methyl-2-oxoglutarate aldolase [Candidatus Latescibacterota bacterium]|jgi:4-hydroxy-4-methyl-2-oxoglutarate aldolase